MLEKLKWFFLKKKYQTFKDYHPEILVLSAQLLCHLQCKTYNFNHAHESKSNKHRELLTDTELRQLHTINSYTRNLFHFSNPLNIASVWHLIKIGSDPLVHLLGNKKNFFFSKSPFIWKWNTYYRIIRLRKHKSLTDP